ncbi:ankyrin repeat domain-containing protein [Dyadobacter flavalbus]|uniref:Ankyrin repeat domain-containing protein n=1 Tax=Dyadobacter flavalbus TaxID=2579942 RepID=A0A5M8QTP9_9BACT|nr:ankyrin repeat domain-containing protein [Dyadobacter flavalbus]KAA6438234.1 ankyrin repeat domain-containing protein [Dyadobacter flavalbus]
MKKLLIAVSTLLSFAVHAQQNALLDQSFWKSSPDVNAVKAEIQKGSNPAQLNPMSFDPVVMAINAQAPRETIEFLLTQPGNTVDKLTHDGRTYLHWAANRGNAEIMEYLVSKGAKADVIDSHGATPLNFAAGGGQLNTKIYDICLAHGADLKKDLNHDGANALLLAVANDKDLTLTNYFISKGLDLKSTDAAGNNAFSYAARGGNIEVLKTLLQKGVPANGNAMLMAAQGTRRGANPIEVYQYLESLNIRPDFTGKNGENALHSIVRKPKQAEIIWYFLGKGVDVNQADEDGNTVFMNAAASNADTAVLGMLASKVKDINLKNQKGVSALAMAVRSNSPEVVDYLIRKGADMKTTDKNGDNLAYYLVQSYSPQKAADFDAKLKVLQDKGFKLTEPQSNGNTLYHLAVAKNDLSLVKRLEGYSIDINSKNKEGLTALHKAAMISKDDTMLKYLISIGAKKDIVTNFEETAFDLAGENESLSKNNVTVNFLK